MQSTEEQDQTDEVDLDETDFSAYIHTHTHTYIHTYTHIHTEHGRARSDRRS